MFQHYTGCVEPQDGQKLWRYVDLGKYIDLLVRRKLFFAAVGRMEDKFEGTYTRRHFPSDADISGMIEYARLHTPELIQGQDDQKLQAIIKASRAASVETVRSVRNCVYVSCWHQNDFESAGMWNLYLKSGEGVAIQTTYGKLKGSLESTLVGSLLLSGQIQYLDYDAEFIDHMDFFLPFMRKRRSFEHEREFRLTCIDLQSLLPTTEGASGEPSPGVDFKANLETLIENVYVAPSAPAWFLNVVKDVTCKYGVDADVRQSDLDKAPVR